MYLGRCFICRSRKPAIDAAMEKDRSTLVNSLFESLMRDRRRFFARDALKFSVVRFRHVGESRSEPLIVFAEEWVCAHQIKMVCDEHQTSLRHVGVQAARRVCEDQILNAKQTKCANRKSHLLHVVAFVIVKTAGLNCQMNAIELT